MKYKINIEMTDYWHVGSGKGGGVEVDARVDLDADGLPYVPGKMLKGLIRDAYKRSFESDKEIELFGSLSSSTDESIGLKRLSTSRGLIFISDARIPLAVRKRINETSIKSSLFRQLHSTKINENGVAEEKSLRGMEVVVPTRLVAEMECPEEFFEEIKLSAMGLVTSVGAHRSRGLGRCKISFEEMN